MTRTDLLVWTVAAIVLTGLSIPWFLWGTSTVVAGLPVWLWWHVGWMLLTGVVFWLFARTAWGLGVEPGPRAGATRSTVVDDRDGDRR